jgi:sporulation-control protein
MLLRKMMSRLGVGSAYVDLILNKTAFQQGECIEGILHIFGGTVEQKIEKLDVEFIQKTLRDGKEVDTVIATIPVAGAFQIEEGQRKQIPFMYQIPDSLPPSQPGISYRFITRLDIEDGVDTLDFDYIQILPR